MSQQPTSSSALVPLRIIAVIALSSVLGLTFNASNPLGVRFAAVVPEQTTVPDGKSATPPSTAANSATTVSVNRIETPAASPSAPSLAQSASQLTSTLAQQTTSILSTPSNAPAFIPPSPITWAQVKPILNDKKLVLVDARIKALFDAGHIPGAIHLPESSPPEDLLAFQKQHGTNTHVVVYCSSTSCSLSYKLAYKLAKDFGFNNIQYMTGGYLEWQRETTLAQPGGEVPGSAPLAPSLPSPIATTALTPLPQAAGLAQPAGTAPPPLPPSVGVSSNLASQLNPQPASWVKVEELTRDSKTVLIDARNPEEYAAGHYPGALSLPANASKETYSTFVKNLGPDRMVVVYGDYSGSMKSFQMARLLLQEHGVKTVRFVMEGYNDRKPATAATQTLKPAP